MNNEIFSKKIKELLPYVLKHAADFYKLKSENDIKDLIKKKKIHEFQDKCHEGFKIAQNKLLKNLLYIEKEYKKNQEKIKVIRKDKYFNLLKKGKEYQSLIAKQNILNLQKATFQEIANCIVWTIYDCDRTSIKSLIQPDMHHKSLLEGNIESLINAAKNFNKSSNKFALITDITSCIGMGDLIIIDTKKSSHAVAEVKEGKVNEVITDSLIKNDLQIAKRYLQQLESSKQKRNFLKQFKRVIDQQLKTKKAIEYTQKGVGKDIFTGENRAIIETEAEVERYSEYIAEGIEALYSQTKNNELYFPFDCGFVGIIRNPTLARKWDFQHSVIHNILQVGGDCAYMLHKNVDASFFKDPKTSKHFNEIQKVPIYSVINKLHCVAHEPIFFNLPLDHSADLFCNKLAIYIYFDHKYFFYLMEKAKLHPVWKPYKEVKTREKSHIAKEVVNFEGKSLYFGTKKNNVPLMYGFLLRIVYEFQTANSVVLELKELVDKIYIDKYLSKIKKVG